MKFRSLIVLSGVVLCSFALVYCKKKADDPNPEEPGVGFDKQAMLANYADNVIIPNFLYAQTAINDLSTAYETFAQNKTVANLQALRQKYIAASISVQHIYTFEFGPSESEIVRSNFNTYPTDTAQIKSNITNGGYNLGSVSNLDAKGFPAVDFLLYSKNMTNNDVIAMFTTDPKATQRTTYLKECVLEMQTKTNAIVSAWRNTYRATFVASTGSQIGSSLGLLLNQLDFEIDMLKNGKIGIPLGKKSLDVILPEKCEAYYAHTISVQLAKECLGNIENVYLGRSRAGTDGIGLDDYLISLNIMRGSVTLDQAIKDQFGIAKQKLSVLNEPLTNELVTNKTAVNDAYTELVKLLVLLKTDTPSALGIVITYQDGDGD